jgi:hypothetical protein
LRYLNRAPRQKTKERPLLDNSGSAYFLMLDNSGSEHILEQDFRGKFLMACRPGEAAAPHVGPNDSLCIGTLIENVL